MTRAYSLEVFPEADPSKNDRTLRWLEAYRRIKDPGFVSVTCSNRRLGIGKTIDLAARIKRVCGWEAVPHISARGRSAFELHRIVELLDKHDLTRALAVRGDEPTGKHDACTSGAELIAFLKQADPRLQVYGTCYPQNHPEDLLGDRELPALRAKQAAGASAFISQFVLEPGILPRFLAELRSNGVSIPVHVGIVHPVDRLYLLRIATRCQVNVPDRYGWEEFEALGREATTHGAGVHLYTLNQPAEPKRSNLPYEPD